MNEREQPTMDCPKCGATYDDFDGVGVVYCEACGFCQHLARRGERPEAEGAPRVLDELLRRAPRVAVAGGAG